MYEPGQWGQIITGFLAAGRRRRLAGRIAVAAFGPMAAGLLAWQGSYAAFSATAGSAADAWTSGSLTLTNNGGGAVYAGTTTATFDQTPITPGAAGRSCITVKSPGTSAGSLRLYRSALADSAPSLGAAIRLTIDAAPVATDILADCAGFPTSGTTNIVTDVTLTALATSYPAATGAVPLASGPARVAYRIGWTFASTGTTAGDDALQGKTVTAGFTWELQ